MRATPSSPSVTRRLVRRRWLGKFARPTSSPYSAPAKDVASTLIRDASFEPVDAGPLRIARYLEPFALAMAQLTTCEIVESPPGIPRFLCLLKLRVIGFPVPPYHGLLRTAIARRDGRDR